MILRAILLSLGQIGDPRFRRVLFLGVGLTLALLLAAYLAVFWLVGWLVGDAISLPFLGEVSWVDDALSWSSLLLMIVLSPFLMIPVASAFTSIFLDDVAQAVEDRHYPGLPKARSTSLSAGIRDSVGFLALLIVVNIAALILALIFAPFAPFIFWGVNGLMLGREYFQLAAMRRLGREEARALRRENQISIWILGTLMAVPLTIPIMNLVVPIIGAAAFTHLIHRLPEAPSARTNPYPEQ
ncbi:Uncharacterized protein involved in cysteine biosynthesis [Poseidonocella pacifica]|uniref:Uncharacterized protein involved in cysteine biosynthesis n=1 Tax=Poseidonocella pacifica TaxID=871651 RepID=A0A1I0WJ94_9RHOB|nr:EI24 domain-containing protein [Poseidonocella pacifica]SFA88308.1 Uncharacterized protein involved in cysteine biosynthesis [Poseidonocella pacifica]